MARRGGVKRISANIYEEVRLALSERLQLVNTTFQPDKIQELILMTLATERYHGSH
jgi:hypothetical protein